VNPARYVAVEKLTGRFLGANILRLDLRPLWTELAQDSRVLGAQARLNFFRLRLEIEIRERSPLVALEIVGQGSFCTDREGVILRTHTSPGQIHAMRAFCPEPVRVILPGMCYRYEQITARSEIMFHQVEGLAVGERVTMSDLKGTLADFARRMFGPERRVRFRPSYFPFTEPSVEVDIDCILCEGRGCRVCKFTGWLEIAGAGMVHPVVLENGGYDPRRFTGFAFGMGPQRITMLKHRIDDIRYFWSNDLRFLEQFG